MTFPLNSPFDEQSKPPTYVTPAPASGAGLVREGQPKDTTSIPYTRLEDWYRTLNDRVRRDEEYHPDDQLLEDLRDEIHSYLRG